MNDEIDISAWDPADDEPLGTKPKFWVRDPSGVRWLWKEATIQRDRRRGEFRKGDDWAEVVAARVAEAMAIPVADVRFAVRDDVFGVVSRWVLSGPEESLVHGNELFAEAGIGSDDPHDRVGYTVKAVALVLQGAAGPERHSSLATAFEWFAGYLVLDALIGNTDRHQDNWGVIRSPSGARLAPSFDHASCLGFMLSDDERLERLGTDDQNRSVAAYGRAARSKFEERPSVVEAAVQALRRCGPGPRRHWRTAVLSHVPALEPILDDVPSHRMSDAARRFASALYDQNLQALSHPLRSMST